MLIRFAVCVALASGLLLFGANAGPASAASSADSWAYDLAGEVMSPFCPGRTLAACPSPQAAELIQWVILQEQAGATRAEVEDQLYARYGDVIRGAPKPEGWGLAAYVIPLLAALSGVVVVYLVLRRISVGGAAAGETLATAVAGDPATTPGASSATPGASSTTPGASAPTPGASSTTPGASAEDDEIARLVDRDLERI